MGIMTTVCDRLVALESGRVITEGACADVLTHPQVIASYLGTSESGDTDDRPTLLLPVGAGE
jgi:ABC-type uncharacterized transport system ATPase subunit